MSDFDSPTDDDDTSTQPQAESDDDDASDEQTTASEPTSSDKSSESERINGLMAVAGRKEGEKQAAIAERDAAIAERDEAAAALAEMQAEYDTYLRGYVEEAPAETQPVAAEQEPAERQYISPVLQQNHGQMPANPLVQPRPRMSDTEAALRGMEQVYADHMRGLN